MKLGQVGSKIRGLGQILGKPCVHCRGHSFNPKFMKLCQNVIIIISRSCWKLGHVGSKIKSLGQILEKLCKHSRGHKFDLKFMKLYQNVDEHNIQVKFETGSC